MFGHDNNQDNHQDNHHHQDDATAAVKPDDTITPSEDQSTDTPLPDSKATTDDGLGSFLPSNEPAAPAVPVANDELLDIKQQALQSLTPLVGHLDQSAEEKFRTTMMMIQASDDHSLIKVAYEAAKQISDEKDRAQALLDIVNEINYFTQHGQNQGEQHQG